MADLRKFRDSIAQRLDVINAALDPKNSGKRLDIIELPMDRFRQKTVSETITCKDAATQAQPFPTMTFTAYYENTPTFDISAGAVASLTPGRQVGAVPSPYSVSSSAAMGSGPCLPANAPATCLEETSRSDFQFMPAVFFELHAANWRWPWAKNGEAYHRFGYVGSIGPAIGLAINPNNGSAQGEFFEGVSIGIQRVALMIGAHNGRYQTFADGYYVGEELPTALSPRTERGWTTHLAFAISYRMPCTNRILLVHQRAERTCCRRFTPSIRLHGSDPGPGRYISCYPMRGARWFLLVAIVAIFGGLTVTYLQQKKTIKAASPARPQSLPDDLSFVAEHTTWSQKAPDRACDKYFIDAGSDRQSKDSSRVDMRDVTLKLYNKDCKSYNFVKTAEASFFSNEHRFYSEGQVQITLSVPLEGESKHELVSIKSAGVTLNTDTGHADTDQWCVFTFENGDGSATGATYDPDSHELQLKHDVVVHRHPPDVKAITIEAGSLLYREASGEVLLSPWGKFTRENTVVEGQNPVIKLRNREYIQQVHATRAHGTDDYPTRKLQYSADDLLMDFDERGEIQKITGEGNGHLLETSETAETTVTGNHVEMNFDVVNKQSQLERVAASGNAVAQAKPLPVPGKELSETHILRSENFEMKMRPGGKDIDRVIAHAPGTLEFLPNLPAQHHRVLSGNDMLIAYGAQNRIDTFHATDVKTTTDANADERKRGRTAPAITASRELAARFDPKTSKLSTMDQQGAFAYDEGDRHARALKASLDSPNNVMLLDTNARLWDSNGSTSADRIRINQATGDFTADGNVKSSRMPEKDAKKNGQLLNGDQPLQAQAAHMESTDRNTVAHYRGNAMMWQGANRIQADTIDLNHKTKRLVADGSVVSNLWEEPKDEDKKNGAKPVLTIVRSPHLVYTDENRLAVYTGGVQLTRPNMLITCVDLRAFLAPQGADNRLEKAFADGNVKIVQRAPDHTRTGTAEHSEYYTDDERVILRGGTPLLVDSVNGKEKEKGQAPEWIYRVDDGSLQGNGAEGIPVQSRILRTKKKN